MGTGQGGRDRVPAVECGQSAGTPRRRVAWIYTLAAAILITVVIVFVMLASGRERANIRILVALLTVQLLLMGAAVLLVCLRGRSDPERAEPAAGDPQAEAAQAARRAEAGLLMWMRHEIRTPINAIVGMADLLLDADPTPTRRDYLESLRASADALSNTVNDMLDLCRLASDRLNLEPQPFEVREAVEAALDQVAASAADRGLDLAYIIDEDTPATLVGDVVRLRQILVTLLGGAVRRTHAGEVSVSVSTRRLSPDRHEMHVVVRDTGVGIPEDRRDLLFSSLDEIVASRERAGDAQALGLTLCKGLTELMGGTLWLERGPYRRSAFHFTIVVEAAVGEASGFLRGVQPQLENARALVVDDSATSRALLTRYMSAWGMRPRATDAPDEALEWIRQGEAFDVAIIDARLPGDAAGTLAAEIARSAGSGGASVVMLYGPELRRTGRPRRGGALAQPIRPAELVAVLTRVLAGRPVEADAIASTVPLRILVAEDNPVSQTVVLSVLQRLGYGADVVSDGRQVLEALERRPYDVVLMDMQMPEMDGESVTRHICARWPQERRPRIIVISASESAEDRARWLAAGADAWVSKTLPVEELRLALARGGTLRAVQAGDVAAGVDRGADDVLSHLRALEEKASPGLAAQVIGVFLGDAAARLTALRDAVARQDRNALERSAHSLKGSAAMVGAMSLADCCAKLIGTARGGSIERVETVVTELEARFEAIQRALTTYLAQQTESQKPTPEFFA